MEEQVQENENSQVAYITLLGGKDTIECYEATIASHKEQLERIEILNKMVEDGSFYKLFNVYPRSEEISRISTFLVDPIKKNKMQDLLVFHAYLEDYFLGLIYKESFHKASIEQLEEEIKHKMSE